MTEKKRGRKSTYKPGIVTEPDYDKTHPEKLLEFLSKGMLDCQIMAELDICKDTFYRWLREHPDFKAAYDKGLPKCESVWVSTMQKNFIEGNDKGFKYCISIMNNKFGWKDKEEVTKNVQNIYNTQNNVNVFQEKSREELLEYLQEELIDNNVVDAQFSIVAPQAKDEPDKQNN